MKEVRVNKPALLEVLRANRARHYEEYSTAMEGYLQEVREALTESLEMLEAGQGANLKRLSGLHTNQPAGHLGDYDRAICMMEMCVDETVLLTEAEFRQYVQDEWHWQEHFKLLASSYAGR